MFHSNRKYLYPKDSVHDIFSQSTSEPANNQNSVVDNNKQEPVDVVGNIKQEPVDLMDSVATRDYQLSLEEIEAVKEAQMKEMNIREKICRDSPELVELKSKLDQAYISKELDLQRAEKEAQQVEQKLMDQFYTHQAMSVNERLAADDQRHEDEMTKKKVEYRKALEQQMQEEQERKKEERYKRHLEERKFTDAELNRITQEDQLAEEERINKMLKLKGEMLEALKMKEELRKCEEPKQRNRNLESYWDRSYAHEKEQKKIVEEKKKCITERQEECARQLEEINKRKVTRCQLLEDIVEMSKMLNDEDVEQKYDLNDMEKKFNQNQLCSELDGQCAVKEKAKQLAKKTNNDFEETWIWGDSSRNIKQEKQKQLSKEVSEYNWGVMLEHQKHKKHHEMTEEDEFDGGNKENEIKKQVITEEKERILKSQDPSVLQNIQGGGPLSSNSNLFY